VSLAAFIADQRTSHHVPHAVACRALTVSESWFYKWNHRQHHRVATPTEQRRAELDTTTRGEPHSTSDAFCQGLQYAMLARHAGQARQPLHVAGRQRLTAPRGQHGVMEEVGCQREHVHHAAGLWRRPNLQAPEE
jgi:hypothetical protein